MIEIRIDLCEDGTRIEGYFQQIATFASALDLIRVLSDNLAAALAEEKKETQLKSHDSG